MLKEKGNRKLPFGKHNKNCLMQESSIHAKIHGQNNDEKRMIYVVSKYLPTEDCLNTMRKSYIYSKETLTDTMLTKRSLLSLLASGTK